MTLFHHHHYCDEGQPCFIIIITVMKVTGCVYDTSVLTYFKFCSSLCAGMKYPSPDENTPFSLRLQQTSTDKLRVIVEGLLDTLLTLTVPSPAQPQPPHPLYLALPPPTSESLFRNLCLLGSRRIQVSACFGQLVVGWPSQKKYHAMCCYCWSLLYSTIFQFQANSQYLCRM